MRIQFAVLFRGLVTAVIGISSFQKQVISNQGMKQLQRSLGYISHLLPMKELAKGHIHGKQGKLTALSDCPD